jgi:YHS domain-containing protein
MEGNPINKAIFVEYKDKKVYFCCPPCKDKFNADPEKYIAKLPQFDEKVQ